MFVILGNWEEASTNGPELKESLPHMKQLKRVACGILAVWTVTTASPVIAANPVSKTILLFNICIPPFEEVNRTYYVYLFILLLQSVVWYHKNIYICLT